MATAGRDPADNRVLTAPDDPLWAPLRSKATSPPPPNPRWFALPAPTLVPLDGARPGVSACPKKILCGSFESQPSCVARVSPIFFPCCVHPWRGVGETRDVAAPCSSLCPAHRARFPSVGQKLTVKQRNLTSFPCPVPSAQAADEALVTAAPNPNVCSPYVSPSFIIVYSICVPPKQNCVTRVRWCPTNTRFGWGPSML